LSYSSADYPEARGADTQNPLIATKPAAPNGATEVE
jgi:hypothetical protein